ncbi:Hypothetical predicted protein [Pelobates cultripes]|uniref:Uncharacterized protein n=1 Tax=Pelobates cultripes TaxID=61616 RepID=A0AAD1RDA7_PELCU|nr:Hypothetical predicted protein [Pelobates cultripes]
MRGSSEIGGKAERSEGNEGSKGAKRRRRGTLKRYNAVTLKLRSNLEKYREAVGRPSLSLDRYLYLLSHRIQEAQHGM